MGMTKAAFSIEEISDVYCRGWDECEDSLKETIEESRKEFVKMPSSELLDAIVWCLQESRKERHEFVRQTLEAFNKKERGMIQ